ncbi:MAG: hypothetical protein WAV21_02980 [Minisyncoccia bacterium]
MIDVNVLNYFLVILGGFGVVWGYRRFSKLQDKKIGEFEYAALSALWGIPVFIFFFQVVKTQTTLLEGIFTVPMLASPYLFGIGVALGYFGSWAVRLYALLEKYLESKKTKRTKE